MKVEVSKENIERIAKDHQCSLDDAARAHLTAQEESARAYKEALASLLGRPKDGGPGVQIKTFTPREIKKHLDKFIIGQEDYKKRLSIAAAYHFAMLKRLRENGAEKKINRFRKKNTIIAGPSGSGKTYCVEVLADLLQVPTNIVDATDYTEAGYVGKNAEDMVRELIDMAPGETKADRTNFISRFGGLIFIDEMDKKAKESGLIGHDISREGFQRAVLKLIERKYVPVENPYSPISMLQEGLDQRSGKKTPRKGTMINTENILFILGGSFQRLNEGLESIVKKRLAAGEGRSKEDGSITVLGFSSTEKKEKEKYKNYFKEANSEDFIRFGMIPELVGRAPIKTYVNPLSKNDLIRIMTETEDSILDQYKFEFSLFGIKVEFTPEAIEYIAEKAENQKTGARALVSVMENFLTEFQYEIPGTNFKELAFTREVCERPKDAILEMLEKSPFVDYVEFFKTECGINLIMEPGAQAFAEEYAVKNNLQVFEALKKLLGSASALNYMNVKGDFTITREMMEDPRYFDKLYVKWHEEQLAAEKHAAHG